MKLLARLGRQRHHVSGFEIDAPMGEFEFSAFARRPQILQPRIRKALSLGPPRDDSGESARASRWLDPDKRRDATVARR